MSEKYELIIRDLMNPQNLSIRKKGFNEFKEVFSKLIDLNNDVWKGLRTNLWKVIEYEVDEIFQNEMIRYSLSELKSKSIKKLIRFIENGTLKKKSIRTTSLSYFKHFSEDNNIALSKSIKRNPKSQYYFIKLLLTNGLLIKMEDVKITKFLSHLFTSDLNDNEKYNFTCIFLQQKTIPVQIITNFIAQFGKNQYIQLGILESISLSFYFWGNQNYHLKHQIINYYDEFLISCLASPHDNIRSESIKILSRFNNPGIRFDTNHDVLFDFWDYLERINIDYSFVSFDSFEIDYLKAQFNCDGEIEESSKQLCGKLEELLTFGVNPHDVAIYIFTYYPRKLLLKLTKNDPIVENRKLAYGGLLNDIYWLHHVEKQFKMVGPIRNWIDLITQILTSQMYEIDKSFLINSSNYLKKFLELIKKLNKDEQELIIIKMKESNKILSLLNSLVKPEINPIYIIELSELLTGEVNYTVLYENIEHYDISVIIQIINDIIEDFDKFGVIAIELIKLNNHNFNLNFIEIIWNNLDIIISDPKRELDTLLSIMNILTKDNDTYIRSKSHFIKKKMLS